MSCVLKKRLSQRDVFKAHRIYALIGFFFFFFLLKNALLSNSNEIQIKFEIGDTSNHPGFTVHIKQPNHQQQK